MEKWWADTVAISIGKGSNSYGCYIAHVREDGQVGFVDLEVGLRGVTVHLLAWRAEAIRAASLRQDKRQ